MTTFRDLFTNQDVEVDPREVKAIISHESKAYVAILKEDGSNCCVASTFPAVCRALGYCEED